MSNFVRYSNVNYVMPFMFTNDLWIIALQELLKEEKNPIKYIYGSVYCAWQSGRHSKVFIKDLNILEQYLDNISKLGLIPNFTFSTLNADKDKLNDEFSNNLLDLAYKYNSYFIVASDKLYEHIKKRYNNAKMVCSVILPSVKFSEFGFNETKFYNKMLDKYEIVVIRPEYTIKNINKLNKLISDISRIEVLINQTCYYNCPYQKKHYAIQEKSDFNINNSPNNKTQVLMNENINSFCPRYTLPSEKYVSVRLNSYQMEQLVQTNIKYFKIQGREGRIQNLYKDLCEFLFNSNINEEDLKRRIDSMVSDIVLNKREFQYLYLLN